MPVTGDDELITPDRGQLLELYSRCGIVPARGGFGCSPLPTCSQSGKLKLITGTWAYVGSGYAEAQVDRHSESKWGQIFILDFVCSERCHPNYRVRGLRRPGDRRASPSGLQIGETGAKESVASAKR
jgi:hypothetical protein